MMLRGTALVLVALGVLSIACDDDNLVSSTTVQGSGILVTEPRDAGNFHSIQFSAVGNVNIGQTDSIGCYITVDDNIMELINTRVENGVLYVESEDGYNLEEYNLAVNLSINTLESVTLNGVGEIRTVGQIQVNQIAFQVTGVGLIDFDLDANSVVTTVTGVASIVLSGSSDSHQIVSAGVGNVSGFGLATENTTAVMAGVGNAEVYATNELNVTIGGLGSVYYIGNPNITAAITGTGRLVDAN